MPVITPDSIDAHLNSGDALINFSFELFPSSAPYVAFNEGEPKLKTGAAPPVGNDASAELIKNLLDENVRRFVVVSDGNQTAQNFVNGLNAAEIPHTVFNLSEDVAADSFMDEEDADAVAERLRQLGYL